MFYALFVCGHYFFSTGLSKSAFSTYYFGELVYFLSFHILCFLSLVLNLMSYLQNYSI